MSHWAACHGHLASWRERLSPLLCWQHTSGCLKHARLLSCVWLGGILDFEDFVQVTSRDLTARLNPEGEILHRKAFGSGHPMKYYFLLIIFLSISGRNNSLFICYPVWCVVPPDLFLFSFPFTFVLKGRGILATDGVDHLRSDVMSWRMKPL